MTRFNEYSLMFISLIISILLFSCNQEKRIENNQLRVVKEKTNAEIIDSNSELEEVFPINNLLVSHQPDTSSILEVKREGIFLIQLTTEESRELEKEDSVKYQFSSEHANNISMALHDLLSTLKINQYWSDKRFVKYYFNNKSYLLDTRKYDKVRMDCCILFKDDQEPKIVECDALDERLIKKYYKNNYR